MSVLLYLAAFAGLAWCGVLVAPHQAHRLRERLEADGTAPDDLSSVTVLIPARNEASSIGRAVAALRTQGRGLDVVVVDDQSTDGTADVARAAAGSALVLRVLTGEPLPEDWAGKLWALEQGRRTVERPFLLLLDADIELAPRLIPALLRAARARDTSVVSLMAELHCVTFWERLLTPAFIFFFKLLYPFAWSNDPRRRTAAAAGGCMLVRTDALRAIGGFSAIRGALIDDCTLAAALKRAAPPIWLGVSRSVRSLRVYGELGEFWQMVSRSAFTQLRYSAVLLVVATLLMIATLLAPVIGVVAAAVTADTALGWWSLGAWLAMSAAYWPVVRFYRQPALWAATLPVAGTLFLAMTWSSALRYWRGTRATWKNREYGRSALNHRDEYWRGLRDMIAPSLGISAWALVTGVAMIKSGLTVPLAALMSLVVYAGSAQLAVLPLIAVGAPLYVLWATALCMNLRFVIFSVHWRKYFGHLPRGQRLLLTYLAADLNYVLFVRRFPDPKPSPEQIPYYLGTATWTWWSWQIPAFAGIALADRIPTEWGLGFAGVLALLGLAYSTLSGTKSWVTAAAAAGVAVAVFSLPLRLNIVVAIVAGVAIGVLLDRRWPDTAPERT